MMHSDEGEFSSDSTLQNSVASRSIWDSGDQTTITESPVKPEIPGSSNESAGTTDQSVLKTDRRFKSVELSAGVPLGADQKYKSAPELTDAKLTVLKMVDGHENVHCTANSSESHLNDNESASVSTVTTETSEVVSQSSNVNTASGPELTEITGKGERNGTNSHAMKCSHCQTTQVGLNNVVENKSGHQRLQLMTSCNAESETNVSSSGLTDQNYVRENCNGDVLEAVPSSKREMDSSGQFTPAAKLSRQCSQLLAEISADSTNIVPDSGNQHCVSGKVNSETQCNLLKPNMQFLGMSKVVYERVVCENQKLQNELDQLQKEVERSRKKEAYQKNMVVQVQKEMEQSLDRERASHKSIMYQVHKKMEKLQAELKLSQEKESEQSKQIRGKESTPQPLDLQASRDKRNMERLRKENETLKKDKEDLKIENESLKNESELLKNEKKTSEYLKNENEVLKNGNEVLERKLEELTQQEPRDTPLANEAELQALLQKEKQSNNSWKKLYGDLIQKVKAKEKELTELREKITEVTNSNMFLTVQVDQFQQDYDTLSKKEAKYKETIKEQKDVISDLHNKYQKEKRRNGTLPNSVGQLPNGNTSVNPVARPALWFTCEKCRQEFTNYGMYMNHLRQCDK